LGSLTFHIKYENILIIFSWFVMCSVLTSPINSVIGQDLISSRWEDNIKREIKIWDARI